MLQICAPETLKLNPKKCELTVKEAQFCGRLIDQNGVKFNLRNYEALFNMLQLTTVGSLMQLVHGANWLRTGIPRFVELINPLRSLLEDQYSTYKTQKKSKIFNRPLTSWGDKEYASFQCLVHAISDHVKPAPRIQQKDFGFHRRFLDTLGSCFDACVSLMWQSVRRHHMIASMHRWISCLGLSKEHYSRGLRLSRNIMLFSPV